MAHKAEIFNSSIVAVGDFNPAIFSPDWLERNKLIGDGDAEEAREGSQGRRLLVSHQVTTFETKWFALQVLENQFSLTSKDVLSPAFKDLAAGIFQLVPHTPITALGLNFSGHYKLSSEDEYHALGDALAPKDVWEELYPDSSAGLAELTIRFQQGSRAEPSDSKDEKRITVQPSSKIKYGVFLSINGHHDLSTNNLNTLTPAERVFSIIDSEWEPAMHDAFRVFDSVIATALLK